MEDMIELKELKKGLKVTKWMPGLDHDRIFPFVKECGMKLPEKERSGKFHNKIKDIYEEVNPGDWIITDKDGNHSAWSKDMFDSFFEYYDDIEFKFRSFRFINNNIWFDKFTKLEIKIISGADIETFKELSNVTLEKLKKVELGVVYGLDKYNSLHRIK